MAREREERACICLKNRSRQPLAELPTLSHCPPTCPTRLATFVTQDLWLSKLVANEAIQVLTDIVSAEIMVSTSNTEINFD